MVAISADDLLNWQSRNLLAIAALVFLCIRLAASSASYWIYSQSFSHELAALDSIPQGSRVIALIENPCGRFWANPRLLHLPGLAIVRKQAFTNGQWTIEGGQLVTTHYFAAKQFSNDPSQVVAPPNCKWPATNLPDALRKFPKRAFDFLWLIDIDKSQWPRRSDMPLVWHSKRSALFDLHTSQAAGAANER